MITHEVKSQTHLFQEILSGRKKHDIRDMRERPYSRGDNLKLLEYDHVNGGFTGHWILARITYITDKVTPCAFSPAVLDRNYGILSLLILDHGVKIK